MIPIDAHPEEARLGRILSDERPEGTSRELLKFPTGDFPQGIGKMVERSDNPLCCTECFAKMHCR
jgi:hypothetical protein